MEKMIKKLLLTASLLVLLCSNVNAETDSIENPFGTGNSTNSSNQQNIIKATKTQKTSNTKTTVKKTTKKTSSKKSASTASCGSYPRTCGQMTSCAQAQAALKCGNTRLDRDHDGIPCETICGG